MKTHENMTVATLKRNISFLTDAKGKKGWLNFDKPYTFTKQIHLRCATFHGSNQIS